MLSRRTVVGIVLIALAGLIFLILRDPTGFADAIRAIAR